MFESRDFHRNYVRILHFFYKRRNRSSFRNVYSASQRVGTNYEAFSLSSSFRSSPTQVSMGESRAQLNLFASAYLTGLSAIKQYFPITINQSVQLFSWLVARHSSATCRLTSKRKQRKIETESGGICRCRRLQPRWDLPASAAGSRDLLKKTVGRGGGGARTCTLTPLSGGPDWMVVPPLGRHTRRHRCPRGTAPLMIFFYSSVQVPHPPHAAACGCVRCLETSEHLPAGARTGGTWRRRVSRPLARSLASRGLELDRAGAARCACVRAAATGAGGRPRDSGARTTPSTSL